MIMCSQHTESQVQMLRGMAREGKRVLRAPIVRMGDMNTRTSIRSNRRMNVVVFICLDMKEIVFVYLHSVPALTKGHMVIDL
jgi:hypothetical protein